MTTWRSNGLLVPHNGSRRAKQRPMEWVLAVRKRSLVALTDPWLVLTTPKDGVIGASRSTDGSQHHVPQASEVSVGGSACGTDLR